MTKRNDSGPSKFLLGDKVRKVKGSHWSGTVVGTCATTLTPEGYCVESDAHPGSVQIYPAAALEKAGGSCNAAVIVGGVRFP